MSKPAWESQFNEWIQLYGESLFRYAHQRVSQEAIAKDLVQETYLAAWRNRDTYNGDASPKTWLFLILKRKLIDHYRKASLVNREVETELDTHEYFDESGHWREDHYPKEWQPQIDPLQSKEFNRVLDQCKAKMKSLPAAVFSLKYLEDQNSDEICAALSITPSHYWVLMHRAKIQLRACLEKNWIHA